MAFREKYDTFIAGFASGVILPLLAGAVIFLFSNENLSLASWFARMVKAGIVTHSISLCVFPNIFIFLLFNRFDMLKATRGVLAVTIVWAVVVFGIKFLS